MIQSSSCFGRNPFVRLGPHLLQCRILCIERAVLHDMHFVSNLYVDNTCSLPRTNHLVHRYWIGISGGSCRSPIVGFGTLFLLLCRIYNTHIIVVSRIRAVDVYSLDIYEPLGTVNCWSMRHMIQSTSCFGRNPFVRLGPDLLQCRILCIERAVLHDMHFVWSFYVDNTCSLPRTNHLVHRHWIGISGWSCRSPIVWFGTLFLLLCSIYNTHIIVVSRIRAVVVYNLDMYEPLGTVNRLSMRHMIQSISCFDRNPFVRFRTHLLQCRILCI
jgi:hypothetical protein